MTLRTIAGEMGISQGNLNYHFKKRAEILEALYFEMVAVFDQRVDELGQRPITIQSIKADMQTSLERMIAYRFFWTDLYNILRQNKAIKTHFEAAYGRRVQGYRALFKYLLERKIMEPFAFEKEQHLLIDRMISYSDTWLYNSIIYEAQIDESYIEEQTLKLFSMLYPYLTASGKLEFQNLFPGLFE